jgi:hypothetical protein
MQKIKENLSLMKVYLNNYFRATENIWQMFNKLKNFFFLHYLSDNHYDLCNTLIKLLLLCILITVLIHYTDAALSLQYHFYCLYESNSVSLI